MKIIYVNCGVKNYLKEDHRSYIRNLCSCEKKAITEVKGSNPVQAWIFFRLSFRNCISCVYNCNDLPSNNSSLRRSHIGFSYVHNFSIEQIKYSLLNCLVRWSKQVWYSLSSRAFNLATALPKLTKINPSIFLDKSKKIGPLLAG